ncbi:inositol-trisphosphate 3-kinase A isoform X1 [Condylostylus longicornis]|uniref:inositol-trisphosphate 3-kinase A isoform X1 n=1 Tax=Condylostylus longicornis TaxID=2530218 RepID=UPI00244E3716|nr:inositol-trisphosphate 3-kinase A isoform X1 [Condylostylus longicornis]
MSSKVLPPAASIILPPSSKKSTTTTTSTTKSTTFNIIKNSTIKLQESNNLKSTTRSLSSNTANKTITTTTATATMDWSNEKIRLNCGIDNISLRQLWKLIVLNSNSNNNNNSNSNNDDSNHNMDNNDNNDHLKQQQQQQQLNIEQYQQQKDNLNNKKNNNYNNSNNENNVISNNNIAEYNREFMPQQLHNKMSLLKFFAINALDLSAPASPVLLQHGNNNKPNGWVQLSGHPESIVPTATGIVRKRIPSLDDNELKSYQSIESDPYASNLIPEFYGVHKINGEYYIELQDLLAGYKDPNVMDIKMGCRTFSETEVSNHTLRSDLYKKMISIDMNAPTDEEHNNKAITKLRYMLFREQISSSHTKGFRIEALRMRGNKPIKDLKTVHSSSQIEITISNFLNGKKSVCRDILKRLKQMRSSIEKSEFFRTHEIVGSSIFIVYDDNKTNVWLIDFAKAKQLPKGFKIDHRKPWSPGNKEDGLLKGMDELIKIFDDIYESMII